VEIGDIHYHLLRNGLILSQIKLKRGRDTVNIEHMLIRANPALLTGEQPKISSVSISGVHAELHQPQQRTLWQQNIHLQRIWQAIHALELNRGTLSLHLHEKSATPLLFSELQLSQQALGEMRSITLLSQLHGAPVTASWVGRGASGLQGEISWKGVDTSLVKIGRAHV